MQKLPLLVVLIGLLSPASSVRCQELLLTPADAYDAIQTRPDSVPITTPDAPLVLGAPNSGDRPVPIQSPSPSDAGDVFRPDPPVQGPVVQGPPMQAPAPQEPAADLPAQVDLRKYLPPPGSQQGQSDCVAWAMGYASYSCQICQSRDKSPSEQCDRFSPAFIYNQLQKNGKGLTPMDAVSFLKRNGCASLATMPQDRSQPTPAAMVEAATFCAIDHQRARNLRDIKTFLSEGYPVVLIVFLNPEFMRYERGVSPYEWSPTDEKKGLHAICAVGYDDTQQALLIMNSSGPTWKDGGFCWASYNNFPTDIVHTSDKQWCVEAHVIKVKRPRPVTVWSSDSDEGRHFQLYEDLKVYNEMEKPITPNGWKVHDVAYAEDGLFVLRDNKTVAMMEGDGSATIPSWLHLNHGDLKNEFVAMLAADSTTNLHVLTGTGKIYEYVKMGSNDGNWKQIRLSTTPDTKAVDLRMTDSELRATTNTGRVFALGERGWTQKADRK